MKVIDALIKIANGEDIEFKMEYDDGIYFFKNMNSRGLCFQYKNGEIEEIKWVIDDEWLNEEIELIQDILNKEEKEYLSAVIRPFRDNVGLIGKCKNKRGEYIWIDFKDFESNIIYFPTFKKGTMYKNMELYKNYSLKELGL